MTAQKVLSNLVKPGRRSVRAALQDLQAELRLLYGLHAPLMMVYGSYARKEENTASDVDILLFYSQKIQPGQEIRHISSILASLNLLYQVLVSILPTCKTDYQKASGIFWQNLRQDGIPIEKI